MNRSNIFNRIFHLYYDGFKNMTIGRKLWTIILIKLFIFFVVFKVFFFSDFLETHFKTDVEKSDYVLKQLTSPKQLKND
ncbi:MAG: DUF4492 domain-containing protein [Salinivirgaceae bacterium]|nr:DUF4492 domain-containing protein [Salinivirgaceae bacterium]